LDEASVEARLALGANAQVWRWEWKQAEEHFRAAIAKAPSAPGGHHWYARLLYPQRRHREALTEIDIAKDLDPQDRSIAIARGSILLYQGRTAEAIEQYRLVASAEPAHSNVYVPLSRALEAAGDFRAAEAAARRAVELTGRASFALSQLGHLYAVNGEDGKAGEVLTELETRHRAGQATAGEIAAIHAGRRDVESALHWLERGLPNRDYYLPILLVDPHYAFLRSETRFEALAKQVGLNPVP
jgi:predicted Zn-dependent protease